MALFNCCLECKPPKRHVRCHSSCEEYKRDKDILEQRNKLIVDAKKKEYRHPKYFKNLGQR